MLSTKLGFSTIKIPSLVLICSACYRRSMRERSGSVWGTGFKPCLKIGCMRRLRTTLKIRRKLVNFRLFSENGDPRRREWLVLQFVSEIVSGQSHYQTSQLHRLLIRSSLFESSQNCYDKLRKWISPCNNFSPALGFLFNRFPQLLDFLHQNQLLPHEFVHSPLDLNLQLEGFKFYLFCLQLNLLDALSLTRN